VTNLPQGESSSEKVCWEIQEFLFNNSSTFTQIVESCNAAKATVSKYLNELVDEGKIIWKPKRKRGESKYALSDRTKDEIKLLMEKQKIKTQIDQMSPQKLQEFKKLLDFLVKSKEGEEFLLSLPDADNPEKIKKFKNVGTKSLLQD
jgi:predicted transcriptional regulator